MKFYRSNKFDLYYYGQINSLRLKSSVASKWVIVNSFRSNVYFAGDGNSSAELNTSRCGEMSPSLTSTPLPYITKRWLNYII